MPPAIAIVAAVAEIGAGYAAATAVGATIGSMVVGGMMMAGGALVVAGTVTGNAKLTQIGAIVGAVGSIGNLAMSAGEVAGSVAGSAAADDAAASSASFDSSALTNPVQQTATDAAGASAPAATAGVADAAAAPAGAAGASDAVAPGPIAAANNTAPLPGSQVSALNPTPSSPASSASFDSSALTNPAPAVQAPTVQAPGAPSAPSAPSAPTTGGGISTPASATPVDPNVPAQQAGMTLWDQIKGGASSTMDWMNQNKEATKAGAGLVQAAMGSTAQQKLAQQQYQYGQDAINAGIARHSAAVSALKINAAKTH